MVDTSDPENWPANAAADALYKIIEGEGKPQDSDSITKECEAPNANFSK